MTLAISITKENATMHRLKFSENIMALILFMAYSMKITHVFFFSLYDSKSVF